MIRKTTYWFSKKIMLKR